MKYMKDSYQKAKQKGGSTLAAFQTKNLNMWVDAPTVWIPDDDVAANNADFDKARLEGAECWVGIGEVVHTLAQRLNIETRATHRHDIVILRKESLE